MLSQAEVLGRAKGIRKLTNFSKAHYADRFGDEWYDELKLDVRGNLQ